MGSGIACGHVTPASLKPVFLFTVSSEPLLTSLGLLNTQASFAAGTGTHKHTHTHTHTYTQKHTSTLKHVCPTRTHVLGQHTHRETHTETHKKHTYTRPVSWAFDSLCIISPLACQPQLTSCWRSEKQNPRHLNRVFFLRWCQPNHILSHPATQGNTRRQESVNVMLFQVSNLYTSNSVSRVEHN